MYNCFPRQNKSLKRDFYTFNIGGGGRGGLYNPDQKQVQNEK